ncbi:MAG: serine--tRNA ligase [bacterium]
MLDLKFIVENPEKVEENCRRRNMPADIPLILELSKERSQIVSEANEMRRRRNELAEIMKGNMEKEERERYVLEGRELKSLIAQRERELAEVESKLDEELRKVPNIAHPSAPIGRDEGDNVEVKRVGEIPKFDFHPKDHLELGSSLDILDFERGAKVAGQKFYYLKNDAALLEFALINYAMGKLISRGFTPYITPDLAKAEILQGTGYNPRGEETQIYSIEGTDLCLIATAEITLGGLFKDEVLSEKELPIKLAGFSHCFRTEAGAYGRAARGLYRVHQFSKVEMFAFTAPEQSEDMHKLFVEIEEDIFSGLGIPFRVVDCCTGDLGAAAYRKFDLEAWMPGKGDWGEVTSASNCTDYQARRLNIRYRRKSDGKLQYVHTLNGTAIAVSRALIAILENYQGEDGSISIPEVLRPTMKKDRIIPIDEDSN